MERATRRVGEKLLILFALGVLGGYAHRLELADVVGVREQVVLGVVGLFVLGAVLADVWRSDEFERRLHAISMSAGFFGGGMAALGLGVLQVGGVSPSSWVWLFVVMMVVATVTWAGAAIYYR
jgi:hypothetical protein